MRLKYDRWPVWSYADLVQISSTSSRLTDPQGSKTGLKAAPELFVDREGLGRTAVHDDVATMAAEFFAAT